MSRLASIPQNARAIFIGPTGSGKSVLARACIVDAIDRQGAHFIVVDPKHDWSWGSRAHDPRFRRIAHDFAELVAHCLEIERGDVAEPIVYRPSDTFEAGGHASLDRVAKLALERRHTTLYYDELSLVAGSGDPRYSAPNWARAMVTGRSLGVGVWNATQRPIAIPKIARTEAEYRFSFFLRDRNDQEIVDQIFGGGVPWTTLAEYKHSFVFATDAMLLGSRALRPKRLALAPSPHLTSARAS